MLSGDILIFISIGYTFSKYTAICSGDHLCLSHAITCSLSNFSFASRLLPRFRLLAFLIALLSAFAALYVYLNLLQPPFRISRLIVLGCRLRNLPISLVPLPIASHLLISSRSFRVNLQYFIPVIDFQRLLWYYITRVLR